MADFEKCYSKVIQIEGGYKLVRLPSEKAETYAGIYRHAHPVWPGWVDLDAGRAPATDLVRSFYRDNFWNVIKGDSIENTKVAFMIYQFGVNASPGVAIKLAQVILHLEADGIVGPKTIAALNTYNPELFVAQYNLAKLIRYRDIVTKDKDKRQFLLGWINAIITAAGAQL